jgi:hypothetical protein
LPKIPWNSSVLPQGLEHLSDLVIGLLFQLPSQIAVYQLASPRRAPTTTWGFPQTSLNSRKHTSQGRETEIG